MFGLVIRVRLKPLPLLLIGRYATLPFFWGGLGLGGGGGVVVLPASLSSFTSFASPPPISRKILPTSHPNRPTSAKCVHGQVL